MMRATLSFKLNISMIASVERTRVVAAIYAEGLYHRERRVHKAVIVECFNYAASARDCAIFSIVVARLFSSSTLSVPTERSI